MVMLLSKHGWWILFSRCITFCVSFGHEFAKGSKVKLLKTDPVRSAPSAVSEFKRHVEGKRNKKYHDKNRILHKDTSTLLYSTQEKMERNLEDVDEILDRQFKFEVSENRTILGSIIDTTIFLGRKDLTLRGHRDDSQFRPDVGEYSTRSVGIFIEILNYKVRGEDP